MSRADELLDAVSNDGIALYTANPDTEGHIVIDDNRKITVPEELRRIAVQFDNNMETVTFDCPRYWDGIDMSEMKVYINYLTKSNVRGMYWAEKVTIDEVDDTIMHFDWTISRNVTLTKGNLSFLVCIRKVDEEGNESNHWNSELNQEMYVSEGLECEESILEAYPDIITQLLTRMDYVEEIATPEHMQNYVNEFLTTTTELRDLVYSYLEQQEVTSPEAMLEYVQYYLDNHPPLLVIGSEKPGIACLWFNTGANSGVKNVTVPLSADNKEASVYAEVENVTGPVYDFTIE
jgi:hypothetical protein